jgi:hypothetical protein
VLKITKGQEAPSVVQQGRISNLSNSKLDAKCKVGYPEGPFSSIPLSRQVSFNHFYLPLAKLA